MNRNARFHQAILIGSTLLGSWLGMQAFHESGHVFGAWLTGGRVSKVVLSPLTISRTDLKENPQPLIVVWAGPVFGVVAPVLGWLAARGLRIPGAFVLRFFAGFCLAANGLYIGVGSFDRVGDCREMLLHGSEDWHLWMFGLMTVIPGFWLWHRQGPEFGFGKGAKPVSPPIAYAALAASLLLLTMGFLVDGK